MRRSNESDRINQEICEFEKVLEFDPNEKNILDYFRTHKGEIELEDYIKDLRMLPKKVINWRKLKRLGERNEKKGFGEDGPGS